MKLNDEERRSYSENGKKFIIELQREIQHSAPGVINSKSKYKDRNISDQYTEQVSAAIAAFKVNSKS